MTDSRGALEAESALKVDVSLAQAGDRGALERVLKAVRSDVYALAMRFLWHPDDAEDATQEILLRVVKGLTSFRGESRFSTWVYRVASNVLLTERARRMEQRTVSFDEFAEDLAQGLSDDSDEWSADPDRVMLLEEVKIGCTTAMLLCLDREHRLAYIMGDIVELDHNEGAAVLEIPPATYRKRLSRARQRIAVFMKRNCGLVNPENPCRCGRRVTTAIAAGRVTPGKLLFASSAKRAAAFPSVLKRIRTLDEDRRAAALFRSHLYPQPSTEFADRMKQIVDKEFNSD